MRVVPKVSSNDNGSSTRSAKLSFVNRRESPRSSSVVAEGTSVLLLSVFLQTSCGAIGSGLEELEPLGRLNIGLSAENPSCGWGLSNVVLSSGSKPCPEVDSELVPGMHCGCGTGESSESGVMVCPSVAVLWVGRCLLRRSVDGYLHKSCFCEQCAHVGFCPLHLICWGVRHRMKCVYSKLELLTFFERQLSHAE